ncbi:cytochrome P450 [Mycena olivaceomarginata]|nr:cytochrome P450 [Mycena olivaceomarginata]
MTPLLERLFGSNVGDTHYEIAGAGIITLLVVYRWLRRNSNCNVRHIDGPAPSSWLFGHMRQISLIPTYGEHEFQWLKTHGPVYRYKGCFGEDRLMISDPAALQYVLNSPHFKFGPGLENVCHLMYGKGSVMCADVEEHKRLRAGLNIGFSAATVRNYIPVFEKALSEQLEDVSGGSTNICPLLSLATLTTMSEAVLGYSIDDLGDEFISNNFHVVGLAAQRSAGQILGAAIGSRMPTFLFRAASYLPTQTLKTIRRGKYLSEQVGNRVVADKKTAAREGLEINTDAFGRLLEQHNAGVARNTLTENEIVAQTSIIMVAGQDTTANTLAFSLLELAKDPELQENLRAEIHATVGNARASSVAYDNMPLLNAFIKETLRMYPGEPMSERVAVRDTVIPLADGIRTSNGEHITHLPVPKGQIITLGIASYQRLESRWGEDAHEFKPSRWIDGGGASKGEAVGPYANLLSFLGGPRTCLG